MSDIKIRICLSESFILQSYDCMSYQYIFAKWHIDNRVFMQTIKQILVLSIKYGSHRKNVFLTLTRGKRFPSRKSYL